MKEGNEAILAKSKQLVNKSDQKDEIEILKSENENLKNKIKELNEVVEQTRSVNEKLFLRLSNQVNGSGDNNDDKNNEDEDEDLKQAKKNIEEYNKKIESQKEK